MRCGQYFLVWLHFSASFFSISWHTQHAVLAYVYKKHAKSCGCCQDTVGHRCPYWTVTVTDEQVLTLTVGYHCSVVFEIPEKNWLLSCRLTFLRCDCPMMAVNLATACIWWAVFCWAGGGVVVACSCRGIRHVVLLCSLHHSPVHLGGRAAVRPQIQNRWLGTIYAGQKVTEIKFSLCCPASDVRLS